MNIIEGSLVSYVGPLEDGLNIGDRGKVLSDDGRAAHVLWQTGALKGKVTLIDHMDIVAAQSRIHSELDDSLDEGTLVTVAVRETYNYGGVEGLLDALETEGHLAVFQPIVDEAIQMVASRLRQDVAFREIIAQLEPDEGDEFLERATYALLRDAFGGDK